MLESETFGRRPRHVNEAAMDRRPAVRDLDHDRAPILQICHPHPCSERQGPVRCHQLSVVEGDAAGRKPASMPGAIPACQTELDRSGFDGPSRQRLSRASSLGSP